MKDTLTSSLVKSNRKWRILRFDNDPDFWEKNEYAERVIFYSIVIFLIFNSNFLHLAYTYYNKLFELQFINKKKIERHREEYFN